MLEKTGMIAFLGNVPGVHYTSDKKNHISADICADIPIKGVPVS